MAQRYPFPFRPSLVVPKTLGSAFTYLQQLAYLNDQIEQLKARVEVLEEAEDPPTEVQ